MEGRRGIVIEGIVTGEGSVHYEFAGSCDDHVCKMVFMARLKLEEIFSCCRSGRHGPGRRLGYTVPAGRERGVHACVVCGGGGGGELFLPSPHRRHGHLLLLLFPLCCDLASHHQVVSCEININTECI